MQQSRNDILKFISVLSIVTLIVIASYFFSFKLDVTEDNRYSLHAETIEFLKDIDEVVTIKVYLEGKDLPPGFVKLKNSIRQTLSEFSSYSGEAIEYEFVNVLELNSKIKQQREIQRLQQIGLQYLPVERKTETGKSEFYVLPGAEIIFGSRTIGVNLLVNNAGMSYDENFTRSIEELEYKFSNSLRKLFQNKQKAVAFLQGQGESGQYQLQDLATTLSEYYLVGPVLLTDEEGKYDVQALKNIDLLIISKPKDVFPPKALYIIDQFVMHGGKLLVLNEGVVAGLDSLRTSNFFPALEKTTEIEDLLFQYGVRLDKNLVQDIQCTQIPLQSTGQGNMSKPKLAPWVFFPLIFTEQNHIINSNLNPLKMEFASTLTPLEQKKAKATVLLKTSGKNKYLQTPTRIGFEQAVSGIDPKLFTDSAKALAVLLEGTFDSYFKNRPIEASFKEHPELGYRSESDSTKILVVSDGDFAENPITANGQPLQLGADRYSSIFFDNKRFLLNAVNYLLGDGAIIPVRSKKVEMRLLDKEKLKTDGDFYAWLNLTLPIALITLIGLTFYFIRKFRYG
jgi:ABC-2 type transport system permease protein